MTQSLSDPLEPMPEEAKAVEAASFVMALRARGVRHVDVLRAMELVPREIFAPQRFRDLARTDVSLPLPCGQTMTAPGVVAAMLVALDPKRDQRIFEIGTGSGYVTALLAQLSGAVHTIERFSSLVASAQERFKLMGLMKAVQIENGDGFSPPFARARFDRILVNGASIGFPPNITSMLAPGGRLVGAIMIEGRSRLVTIERNAAGDLRQDIGAPLRITALAAGLAEAL